MSQDYDKIFKENIGNLFLALSEKYWGLKIVKSQELKDKLQTTLEVESDFIRWVETETGETFILQLEFQSQDDSEMLLRM
jgi:hypothetical protein